MAGVKPGQVVVVGSINVDLVVRAQRLPRPGETVLGGSFAQHHGGKGANQAVAAARVGARVRLIGAVGDDLRGDAALAALAEEGVDVARVARRAAPTGVAIIAVDADGENQIVVAPGANALVGPEDITDDALADATALLTGFELPMVVVEEAVRRAAEHDIPVIVNVAPAAPIPSALLTVAPVLVLNERESRVVAGHERPDRALDALARMSRGPVVVTRGALGGTLAIGDGRWPVAAFPAPAVVDTTGAGDAFVGVVSARLGAGASLEEALRAGSAAGALSVGGAGAREGMPTTAELAAFLGAHRT
jgi:ribokinase